MTANQQPLRVLHLDGFGRELHFAGEPRRYAVVMRQATDESDLLQALGEECWDAIVCRLPLPGVAALRVVEVSRRAAPDVPLILVSGPIGEEAAVALIQAGASDYVREDNLARIPSAVARGIREAQARRAASEAAEAVRDSRQRLDLWMNAIRLGTFDFDPGSGRLAWNDVARRYFGVSPEAEISTDTFLRAVHPEDRGRVAEVHRNAARPGHDGSYSLEFRVVGIEDGVERWLAATGRVLPGEGVHAARRVGVFADVTEKRRKEEALRAALADAEKGHRLLDAVFRTQTDALLVCDEEGQILRTNPAAEAFFGFDPTGMTIVDIAERLGIEGGLEVCMTSRALHGEATLHAEQRLGDRIVETSSAPMRDGEGAILGAVTILRDVTERRRSEQRVRQAQKLESIGLLAGGVAHDFNNILTSVIGNISMVLEDNSCNGEVRSSLATALDSAQRAAALTMQLLAYAGKGAFVRQPVVVEDVVEGTLELLRASTSERVGMMAHTDPDLPRLQMDPGQLQQIVMNLVVNGIEAIGEAETGVVVVRSKLAGKFVMIEVSDSGCGMEPALQERMFDPFFTTKFTGRGLGLAAVEGIVRAMHGEISVDSTPGQGARIRVMLPAAPESYQ